MQNFVNNHVVFSFGDENEICREFIALLPRQLCETPKFVMGYGNKFVMPCSVKPTLISGASLLFKEHKLLQFTLSLYHTHLQEHT